MKEYYLDLVGLRTVLQTPGDIIISDNLRPFLPLFGLSSLPCVSKAASSARKINQKLLAERCFAVFSGLQYWEMQASENLLVFNSPQPKPPSLYCL